MKKIRQSVSILLTMIMVLSVFTVSPFSVFADDNTVTDETTLIAKINAGESVKLGAPIILESMLNIPSGKEVTIDLNGYKLDRNLSEAVRGGSVIYVSEYSKLTVADSSGNNSGLITGGYADDGGGVYVDGTFVMTGGTISGNNALSNGGGILFLNGSANITSGIIENNTAKNGGGIYNNKQSTLEIGEAIIRNNTAESSGGGIYALSTLIATGSEISGNIAKYSGGGIYYSLDDYSNREFKLTNCTISNNKVTSASNDFLYGGGICVAGGTATLTNCIVNDNTVENLSTSNLAADGGGICLSESSRLVMSGGSISNNTAGYGGGIHMNGLLSNTVEANLNDVIISGNTALSQGGGICASNRNILSLTNSTVSDNTAQRSGGGIQYDGMTDIHRFTINGSTITQNSSSMDGGGIYINRGLATITDSLITKNSASSGGGAYLSFSTYTNFVNTEISGNRATAKAGGIFSFGDVKLTDTTVTGNSAPVCGGIYAGIYADRTLKAEGKIIVQNNTPDDVILDEEKIELTGALTDGAKISISTNDFSSTFTKNYSTYHKGEEPTKYFTTKMGDTSIVVDESGELKFNINVAHNEEELKSAFRAGGSVSLGDDIELTSALQLVNGAKLSLNLNGYTLRRYVETASNGGSVITISENSALTIIDTSGENIGTITGGNAINGGAVYNEGTLNISGGTFTASKTTKDGGCIYNTGTLNITGGVISENTAGGNGAAIYSSGTAVIENADISDNIKAINGGAIANYGTMTIKDCTINNNTATNSGGGIYNGNNADNPCTLEISGNTTINYNNAKQGGSIYADTNSTVTLTSGELKRNKTSGEGGGVYVQTNATFIMTDGVITNSVADANGGAVMNYGTVTMTGGTINNNTSELNGGGIYQAGTLNMQGAVVVTNNSLEDVYLPKDKKITVTGKFVQTTDDTQGTIIGIGLPNDDSAVITTNYRRYNDTNPSTYFVGGISTDAKAEMQGNEVKITLTPVPMDIAQETEAVVDYEYDEFGEKIGINNISISPYYFYDISNITGSRQLTVGTLEQVSSHLFTSWAPIATRIFSTYTDATFHNTGSWSKWFGSGVSEEDQKTDIGAYFAGTNRSGDKYEHGEKANDYIVTSGLSYANDLNDIVNRMSKDVADGMGDRYNTSASTIYDKCDLKTIKEMNKDNKTHAFYRTVTQIDENGATYGYYFNSYAVAFYDFELSPVAAPGITASNVREKLSTSGNKTSASSGYFENKSKVYSDISVELQTSYTESVSNSFTDTSSWKLGNTFEFSSETELAKFLGFAAQYKATFKNSTTIEKVWEASQTEEHGVTSTFDKKTSAALTLPPHTAVEINQSEEDISEIITYDCPTILRYKVAIFSMSGFRYDDRALTEYWTDTKDFYTIFGSGNVQGGQYATDNLYARAFANKNKIERAYGNVVGHKNGRTVVSEINWNDFNDLRTPMLKAATNIPLFASGATMSVSQKSKSTVLGNLYSLYPLSRIKLSEGQSRYDFAIGDNFDFSALKVAGYDSYGIPYYNFDPDNGKWILCDKNGNALNKSSIAEINQSAGNGVLTAKKAGEVYIKWVINDGVTYTAKYGEDVTSTQNAPISPMIQIVIKANPENFDGYVVRTEGNPQAIVGETLNLFNALSPAVYDNEDILFTRAVTFEAQDQSETSPVTIDTEGNFVSTNTGNYKVRARYTKNGISIKSDWVTVKVIPTPEPYAVLLNYNNIELKAGTTRHLTPTVYPTEARTKLTWTSSDENVATVSSDGLVTAKGKGTALVTVTTENGLTSVCTVTVKEVESVALNKDTMTLGVGQSYTLKPTATPDNIENTTFTWKSSNKAVATVTSKGKVTGRAVGKATITVTTDNGKTTTCTIIVKPAPTGVTLNKTAVNVGVGQKYTLTATLTPSNAATYCTWTSSDTSIATVTSSGIVTGKKTGTAIITVKTTNGKTTECKVNVKKAPSSITLDKTELTLKAGEEYTLVKTLTPTNSATSYKWVSSNEAFVKVNSLGKVTAKKKGTATVTVTTHNGKTAQCKVTVE